MKKYGILLSIGMFCVSAVFSQDGVQAEQKSPELDVRLKEILEPTPSWVNEEYPVPQGLTLGDIKLGNIAHNGSGCRPNTVTATMTEDKKAIAVLFSNYKAKVGEEDESQSADCNIAIPVIVPPGIAVGIVGITWRGTARAGEDGGLVELYREYFFSGKKGPTRIDQWEDGETERFKKEDKIPFAEIVWSGCEGEQFIARADTEAYAEGYGSQINIRAADITGSLILYLAFKQCDK